MTSQTLQPGSWTPRQQVGVPELLLPAGDPEKMRYAIAYGADAVYLGLPVASLRMVHSKDPFTADNLATHIDYCHQHGVKAYVTLNIFASNRDLDRLAPHAEMLAESGADAIILSDPGVFRVVRKHAPNLPIHISTQANTLNVDACAFWQDLGVPRVILAREVPLRDMTEIAQALPDLELECFVHGSLCVAYSGRCVISDYLTDNTKNSNKGMCGNSCRWEMEVKEVTRPDETYTLVEDEKGSYLLNSKDLCLVRYLKELRDAGIVSFKIEGRTKGTHYVATVGRVYREALDRLAADDPAEDFQITAWEDELRESGHRGFTEGFLFGKPGSQGINYVDSSSHATASFVAITSGKRDDQGRIELIGRNPFSLTQPLTLTTPQGVYHETATGAWDKNGLPVSQMHPNHHAWVAFDTASALHSLDESTLRWAMVRASLTESTEKTKATATCS